MSAPVKLVVTRNDRGGFVVDAEPGADAQFHAEYATHSGAATFARMLGKLRDLPVEDRTGLTPASATGVPITSRKGGAR